MPQNRGCLEQRVIWRQSSIGPDFQNEFVIIGALTDTRVFHRIFHACDRRKDGIDGNEADRLIGALVFLTSGKSTTDAHFKFRVELMFPVQGANQLLRIQHFKTLNGLDVPGSDLAFLVDGERQFLWLVVLAIEFKFHFLEIENDIGHVLNHTR